MSEDLETWGARARDQLAALGPNSIRFHAGAALTPAMVADVLGERDALTWGDGYMAHEEGTVNDGRRVCQLAAYATPFGATVKSYLFLVAKLANRSLWRLPDLEPMEHAHWNHYPAGGFITWHQDTEPGDPRALTVICLLRQGNPDDGLMLNGHGTIPLQPGEAIVFPAFIFHRVPPVQTPRDSLTLWCTSSHRLEN